MPRRYTLLEFRDTVRPLLVHVGPLLEVILCDGGVPVRIPEELCRLIDDLSEVGLGAPAPAHGVLPRGRCLRQVSVAAVVVALRILVVRLAELLVDVRAVVGALEDVVALVEGLAGPRVEQTGRPLRGSVRGQDGVRGGSSGAKVIGVLLTQNCKQWRILRDFAFKANS